MKTKNKKRAEVLLEKINERKNFLLSCMEEMYFWKFMVYPDYDFNEVIANDETVDKLYKILEKTLN